MKTNNRSKKKSLSQTISALSTEIMLICLLIAGMFFGYKAISSLLKANPDVFTLPLGFSAIVLLYICFLRKSFFTYHRVIQDKCEIGSHRTIASKLRKKGDSGVYHRIVRRRLFALQQFFAAQETLFSPKSYSRFLLGAYLYTIGLILLSWLVSGHEIAIGEAILLPASSDFGARFVACIVIGGMMCVFLKGYALNKTDQMICCGISALLFSIPLITTAHNTGTIIVGLLLFEVIVIVKFISLLFPIVSALFRKIVDSIMSSLTGSVFSIGIAYYAAYSLNSALSSILLFFVLLPHVNAAFNMLAFASMRFLVGKNASTVYSLPYLIVDLVIAACLLVMLIMTLTFTVTLGGQIHSLGGGTASFLSFDAEFELLRNGHYLDPSLHWIYGMLCATALPSLWHMAVVVKSRYLLLVENQLSEIENKITCVITKLNGDRDIYYHANSKEARRAAWWLTLTQSYAPKLLAITVFMLCLTITAPYFSWLINVAEFGKFAAGWLLGPTGA